MEKSLKTGGRKSSLTPSTALLNPKPGTYLTPRMLTESEVELLRRSKREIGEVARKKFKELRESSK